MFKTVKEGDVWTVIMNLVALLVYTTILLPPFAFAIGASIWIVRYGKNGDLTFPSLAVDSQVQLLIVLAIAGLYILIVYLVVRETFGASETENAKEDLLDTPDDAQEALQDAQENKD